MQFEFAAPSASDAGNRSANTARLINCYREPVGDGAVWLKSLPGTEAFATVPGVFCRAMAEVEDAIYVIQGPNLVSVNPAGVVGVKGSVINNGAASISGNNGKVTAVSGGIYYLLDGTNLTTPSMGPLTDAIDVTFYGQLTVLIDSDRKVAWSDPATPETIDGLSFLTTEARDDKNLRVLPVGSSLWVFKETSIEELYQDGAGLAVVPGSTIDLGLKDRDLLTRVPGGAFFIGDDGKAHVARGGLTEVSNAAVRHSIASQDPRRVFYFEDEGNEFCAISFDNRLTWVLSLATGEWCERGEGGNIGSWSAKACVKRLGQFYTCNDIGELRLLKRNNVDVSAPLVRRVVSRTLRQDGNRFTIPKVEVVARVGFYDTEPSVVMRMSKNYGMTWDFERQKGLGKRGEYETRVVFRRLGQYRQATMELTCSDPEDVTINATVFA